MAIHSLAELVAYARERSPFYRELYAELPVSLPRDVAIAALPAVDQSAFWAAGAAHRLLTGEAREGVVFKSGGTTGSPKHSYFTREEWEAFTRAMGRGMAAGGLHDGDRVANLFYAGDLYASFLFIQDSILRAPRGAVAFPIAGAAPPPTVAELVRDHAIDTLAGVPTHLLRLAEYLRERGESLPGVRRVLFGGEGLYAAQRARLGETFRGAEIVSIGYASVDAGLLGYAARDCGPDEHRVFGPETIVELVDEDTGAPIEAAGQPGRLLVTNLTRRLMPILRYPAGDRAEWTESPCADRKFRLLGRSDEAARVGAASVYYDDLAPVIAENLADVAVEGYQLVIVHEDGRDRLIVRLATARPGRLDAPARALASTALHRARPMLEELAAEGLIHPVTWEAVSPTALAANARTGKLRRVLDLRRAAH